MDATAGQEAPIRPRDDIATALTASAWLRLGIAIVPVVLLWLAVAWALR